jgi:DNA ligase-1
MPDLADGETTEMKGSGSKPYLLKNTGGVYSCSCPAWRNQSNAIEQRTCKHLRKLRGDAAEEERIGGALPQRPVKSSDGEEGEAGPPVLLAHSWDNDQDLAGWWMSEKLDGVRAYWDGTQFLSRQGNLFHAPDWFLEVLPKTPLDGELWIDRKKFQRTVSIVRRQDKTDLWKEVKYVVFDAPTHEGVFEDRLKHLEELLQPLTGKQVEAHRHERCRDLDHLREELKRIEGLGGEGLMLRQPQSNYEAGRSMTLLKVKTFLDDEAEVIGHEAGAGRHKGRLGALLVKLPNGIQFSVGTGLSDRDRGNPPAIGSIITFRYQELSEAGVPRFPSYVGERIDAAKPTPKSTPVETVAAAPTPTPAPVVATTPGAARYFEFVDDKSSKFWEVSQSGNAMTTRWGKIGTAGQSKTKTFADEDAAKKATQKLIDEKTGDGYVERG